MATPTATLYTRIPVDLNEKLETRTKETGEKKQEIVRKALEQYLKNAQPGSSQGAGQKEDLK